MIKVSSITGLTARGLAGLQDFQPARLHFSLFESFFVGTVLSASVNMLVFSTIVLMPQFLQNLMGYTAILSGLTIAPRMISSVIMIAAINSLMRVFYSRILISIGFLFLGISIFSYVNLNPQVSFP